MLDGRLLVDAHLHPPRLKVHPVHGGFSPADPMLYPAYHACAERGLPLVVHCGSST